MTPAIDVDLGLEGDHAFDIWTEDSTLVVNAPSLWSLRELQSLFATLPVDPGELTARPVGLDLEVRVRRATVARASADEGVTVLPAGATPDWRGVLVAAVRALG